MCRSAGPGDTTIGPSLFGSRPGRILPVGSSRVAGADANPYLVLATVLAGVHHGIQHRLDPGEPSVGNVCGDRDPDLSFSWQAALDALAVGQILSEYLGADYLDLYRLTKQFEHDNYYDQFSPLEFDWYLNLG